MSNLSKYKLVLAALLHDIGKFGQRADDNGVKYSKSLWSDIKKLEALYCPLQQNSYYSHKHVLWTAQFIADNESFYKQLLGNDHYQGFFQAAVAHHRPDENNFEQTLIQKADHYASGVDRRESQGQKDATAEGNWDAFKDIRMVSVFEGIDLTAGADSPSREYRFSLPISRLSVDEGMMPSDHITSSGQPDYQALWELFTADLKTLHERNSDIQSYVDSLLYLLHRFTIAIPSSVKHLLDVSLYDHLKITAAFAACLADYCAHTGKNPRDISDADTPALLVGGDLSGIQKYIYDIASSDAAKNLKGRSFYLQMLVDNVVDYLCDELDLPACNVVYSSGGGFYLLAPNTPVALNKLEKLRSEITEILFEEHNTQFFLSMAWTDLPQGDIMNRTIHQNWKRLSEQLNSNKRRKFSEMLINSYDDFFEKSEIGGKQQRDAITNEEFSEAENKAALNKQSGIIEFLVKEADITGKPVKKSTWKQIEMGRLLKKSDVWITSRQQIPHIDKRFCFQIGNFPVYNYLLENKDNGRNTISADGIRGLYFEKPQAAQGQGNSLGLTGKNNVTGFTLYGGNDYPKDKDDSPLPFDKLAEQNGGRGAKMLGVLRMDIDNLGQVFKNGLGDADKRTFSRYATLSRSLDWFFRGYLNNLWAQDKYSNSTYILYAGGDDLFIVGYWNTVIDLAAAINDKFKEWTCHNPSFSLSGGIAIVPSKFPISKAAAMAEEAEKLAKKHSCLGQDKNAFALFNTPLNWDREFQLVRDLKCEMVDNIDKEDLPRGLLQKLMTYADIAATQREKGKAPSWKWHLPYDFARAEERAKRGNAKEYYRKLKNAIFSDQWDGESIKSDRYSFLELLAVAARWAELETKP